MNALTKDFTDAVEKQFSALNADVQDALRKAGVAEEIGRQLEQKMARRPGSAGFETQAFGAQLAESDSFKSFQTSGYQGKARIQLKAITATDAGSAWSARDSDIARMARQPLRLRDLLTVVPTTSGSVDYTRQTTRTNAAAPVAEGALKPYSSYVWEEVNLPIRTIAHLAKITRQAMDDAQQLAAEVEDEMRYGLAFAEDDQILNGDGTGQNLDGLIANATAYSAPFDPAGTETMIDQIGLAILQQSLTDFATDGIVMHPSDWTRIRLIKDADGNYVLGDPGAQVEPRLFSLPVVTTKAISVDKFLIGGFKLQKLYDRLAPEVLISSENVDDFERNLFTMRCEERVGLAVRQPTATIYGDFGNVTE